MQRPAGHCVCRDMRDAGRAEMRDTGNAEVRDIECSKRCRTVICWACRFKGLWVCPEMRITESADIRNTEFVEGHHVCREMWDTEMWDTNCAPWVFRNIGGPCRMQRWHWVCTKMWDNGYADMINRMCRYKGGPLHVQMRDFEYAESCEKCGFWV